MRALLLVGLFLALGCDWRERQIRAARDAEIADWIEEEINAVCMASEPGTSDPGALALDRLLDRLEEEKP